jgi:putative protease
MAVLSIARSLGLEVHISTQASVANAEAVKFYAGLGAKRIVLARECSLNDIAEIICQLRKDQTECEIEVFIHGAMCVSVSGRCFLSQEAFKESANKGRCLQPCRREYLIKEADGESEFIIGKDYILSPRDMCSVEFIDQLIETGVSSFKIEGRMRPPEYVSTVTGVYRKAIDAYAEGALTDKLKKNLLKSLSSVYNRGFSQGFYFEVPADLGSKGPQSPGRKIYIGRIEKFYGNIGVAEVIIHDGAINTGDNMLVIGKKTAPQWLNIESMERDHQRITSAGKGQNVAIKIPFRVRKGDKIFRWEE